MNDTETENAAECPDCEGLGKLEPRGELSFICLKCHGTGSTAPPKPSAKVMQGPFSGWSEERFHKLCDLDDGECGAISPEMLRMLTLHQMLKDGTIGIAGRIEMELCRAKGMFPDWPTDPIHAFAIVAEEFGEAAKEVLQLTYEPTKSTVERIRTETIQLAAMCHRFLESLDRYEFKPSAQHEQK